MLYYVVENNRNIFISLHNFEIFVASNRRATYADNKQSVCNIIHPIFPVKIKANLRSHLLLQHPLLEELQSKVGYIIITI